MILVIIQFNATIRDKNNPRAFLGLFLYSKIIQNISKLYIAIYKNGTYIKNRLNLSHRPAYEKAVSLNFSLSPIMKKTKNKTANANEVTQTAPCIISPLPNEKIPHNSGKNSNAIKPSAEPAP